MNTIPLREIHDISLPQNQGNFFYNPTILEVNGKIVGFARSTNISYLPQVDYAGRSIPRVKVSHLLNGIIGFELDKKFNITKIDEVKPLERIPNLEDPKAFSQNEKILLFCNLVSKEQSTDDRKMHSKVASLNIEDGKICIYDSPLNKDIEKNWIPFSFRNDSINFFYSVEPQLIFSMNFKNSEPRIQLLNTVSSQNLHGGSQVVQIESNLFMRVARRRVIIPWRRIATLSYLIFHNANGEIIRISDPFVFRKYGFEICNGLTVAGSDVLFSWGEDDFRMFIGVISSSELIRWSRQE